MKAKEESIIEGLQELTQSQIIFNNMMEREAIKGTGLNGASYDMIREVITLVVSMLKELEGEELDRFIVKFDVLLLEDVKNQLWENNHLKITQAIGKHCSIYNAMPNKSQISNATGISRQTVHKHLKDYGSNPLFTEQVDQFKFMGARVMGRVLESALCGDTKAARLYFDMIGQSVKPLPPPPR